MLEAFGLGAAAQSSLLIAGVIVCWIKVPSKLVGILAGFGAGAMISAIASISCPKHRRTSRNGRRSCGC
jgi:zinc transporter, ZIP family